MTSTPIRRIFTVLKFHRHFHQRFLSRNRDHITQIEDTMSQLQQVDATTLSRSETARHPPTESADGPASPILIAALVDHTKHVLQLTENAIQTLRTHIALTKARIVQLSAQTQDLKTQHKLRALGWELASAEEDCEKGEWAQLQMNRFMEAVKKDAFRWTQMEAEGLWKLMENTDTAGPLTNTTEQASPAETAFLLSRFKDYIRNLESTLEITQTDLKRKPSNQGAGTEAQGAARADKNMRSAVEGDG
ncbi:hypothetical protein E8E11_011140 [Didymella keratinophila]|nr:hypothetical protein E8E11_011140 [Didymella keratinophila]